MRRVLLAALCVTAAGAKAESEASSCGFATARQWLHHCAIAEDCTTEPQFCTCCEVHRKKTAYEEACVAICSSHWEKWEEEREEYAGEVRDEGFSMVEFGVAATAQNPLDPGPHFDQPALSLVGDVRFAGFEPHLTPLNHTRITWH